MRVSFHRASGCNREERNEIDMSASTVSVLVIAVCGVLQLWRLQPAQAAWSV